MEGQEGERSKVKGKGEESVGSIEFVGSIELGDLTHNPTNPGNLWTDIRRAKSNRSKGQRHRQENRRSYKARRLGGLPAWAGWEAQSSKGIGQKLGSWC
jgi:hypothetical protein